MVLPSTTTERLLSGLAIRLILIFLICPLVDFYLETPYTDIDYFVFSDAAGALIDGKSPYDDTGLAYGYPVDLPVKSTASRRPERYNRPVLLEENTKYRYSPILAVLLQGNHVDWIRFVPSAFLGWRWDAAASKESSLWFGKLLFVLADVACGWLLEKLLMQKSTSSSSSGTKTTTSEGKNKRVIAGETHEQTTSSYKNPSTTPSNVAGRGTTQVSTSTAAIDNLEHVGKLVFGKLTFLLWLGNPVVIALSTRGSCDVCTSLLLFLGLLLFSRKRSVAAAGVLGLATHMRIYPVVYIVPLGLAIWFDAVSSSAATFADEGRGSDSTDPDADAQHVVAHDDMKYGNSKRNQSYFQTTKVGAKLLLSLCGFATGFLLPTLLSYSYFGHAYLDAAFFHHGRRIDTKHNFSPYFFLFAKLLGEGGGEDGGSATVLVLRLFSTGLQLTLVVVAGVYLWLGPRDQELQWAGLLQKIMFRFNCIPVSGGKISRSTALQKQSAGVQTKSPAALLARKNRKRSQTPKMKTRTSNAASLSASTGSTASPRERLARPMRQEQDAAAVPSGDDTDEEHESKHPRSSAAKIEETLHQSLLLQSLVFVLANRVCTAQYFLWWMQFLPLVLPNLILLKPTRDSRRRSSSDIRSRTSRKSIKSTTSAISLFTVFGAFGCSVLNWLFWAYVLEFRGIASVRPVVFCSSLAVSGTQGLLVRKFANLFYSEEQK
ncbi:unnamed protein product [Amoebophrya sp. A120]|nr:unnamed protein product [Amoebophrya sp. A120]|eukprot:GSA120T00009366001.1